MSADTNRDHAIERDPHSFAHPDEVRIKHIGVDWDVSFDEKRLNAVATLLVERLHASAPLRLDTRDIEIESAETSTDKAPIGDHKVPQLAVDGMEANWASTNFRLGERDPDFGSLLEIDLPDTGVGEILVRIRYRTTPEASGLQWLAPEQTAGKGHPFLYSQAQSIHARSYVPCQDSPGVRFSFDAAMHVPAPLKAVMTAEHLETKDNSNGSRTYRFVMPQPIPSYLFALAVGNLSFKELGKRSGVYAEAATLETAVHEFAETEDMIDAAEALYGPYQWGRYDLLVLPPAFPFGGMENPRLTFVTPTVLAGDRSLVSLVAHELAHSWSGNLATNATWSDLWLNEGLTVYAERRIVETLYGVGRAQMEACIGYRELLRTIEVDMADTPDDQKLKVDLRGRDPDDNMNAVPYQKGALLLHGLEAAYGREVFDQFLKAWLKKYSFQSVTTDNFRAFLKSELLDKATPRPGSKVPDIDTWIYQPGLPAEAIAPQSEPLDSVKSLAKGWISGILTTNDFDPTDWSPHQWIYFLRELPDDLGAEKMAELDKAFHLLASGNSEIIGQWLAMAATHRYAAANERIDSFLQSVGRRKFQVQIFRELMRSPEGKKQALDIYSRARAGYHTISQRTLDELLGYAPN